MKRVICHRSVDDQDSWKNEDTRDLGPALEAGIPWQYQRQKSPTRRLQVQFKMAIWPAWDSDRPGSKS